MAERGIMAEIKGLSDIEKKDGFVLKTETGMRGDQLVTYTVKLKPLPKDQITLSLEEEGTCVYASLYTNQGYRHYEKYPLSDLPNDLISLEDLERFGVIVGGNNEASRSD